MKKILLSLLILVPISTFANGNCAYVAKRDCYHQRPFTRLGVRVACAISSNREEGMFTSSSLAECKSEAQRYGQYIVVSYLDFETSKKTSAEVYRDFR